MKGELKPCPHCGKESFLLTTALIAEMLNEIPLDPELAADQITYEKRLKTCESCDDLKESVMCAHCGCFVQFRARPVKSYCPHPEGDKWKFVV